MRAAVFAYSARGCGTARRLMAALPDWDCRAYTAERLAGEGFAPLEKPFRPFYGALFAEMDALFFVGSCGIAVREIAPHLRSKTTDPAVLVTDERGGFVIPLLSGHIGGANALALRLAEALGAQPVITTATDINGRFSVDAWAARQGFAISSMALAKAFSAAILEGDLPLSTELPLGSPCPPGLFRGESGALGLYIGYEERQPFERTLRLIPPMLHLGLGCRRGTEKAAIAEAVEAVLSEHHIDPRSLCCAASIDLKKDEAGLLAFCEERGLPLSFYPAEALGALPGDFTPSAFVSRITGVDNVCERAALMGAHHLIVKKTAIRGVTVALAAENTEVGFV